MTKKCSNCGSEKQISEFYHSAKSTYKNGINTFCKDCCRENSRIWRQNNKEKKRAWRIIYKQKNPRDRHRRQTKIYGITLNDYDLIIKKQSNCCAICGIIGNGKKHFAVDHDHATGKIRGLLCTRCNTGLGFYLDNPDLLIKAALYLQNNTRPIKEAAGDI